MKATMTINYKEILKDIVNDIDRLEELEKENERLKKDLEVLDIFKDLFNYELVQDFIEHTTIEEWFKIKEWFNK